MWVLIGGKLLIYNCLPKRHWKKQDYLLYIYDILGDMLRQADKKKLSEIEISLTGQDQANSFKNADDIFVWLDNNDYHDKALKLFNSHVFFLLLKDFCYYTYESISCTQRGKVTVAYTLLRKPMRDNLLYMEWLLANCEEFYQTFLYGSPDKYDISNYCSFPKERIRRIIETASSKSFMGGVLNKSNLIYKFRFSGREKIGLQRIWNQSMHLVTKSKHYKTERTNLNFIFADEEIWNEYWDYYYIIMPYLMAYVLEICEALFTNILEVDNLNIFLNRYVRSSKLFAVCPDLSIPKVVKDAPKDFSKLMGENNINISLKCKKCNMEIPLTSELIEQMVNNWVFFCPSCNEEYSICRYYTDFKLC